MKYQNNCYGFVQSALAGDSEHDCFCDIGDLALGTQIGKLRYLGLSTKEELFQIFQNYPAKYYILELLSSQYKKDSQHVAIIDNDGNFSDQNGPDGEIRITRNTMELLEEYADVWGCNYYNVYLLKQSAQEKNIDQFLSDLE